MGNICSCLPSKQEQAASHPFNAPGRTLDSARPAQQPGASSSNMGQAQSSKTAQGQTPIQASDAQPQRREIDAEERAARARAVEARMKKPQGQLGQKLDQQKRRTAADELQDASNQERGARNQDAGHAARAWE